MKNILSKKYTLKELFVPIPKMKEGDKFESPDKVNEEKKQQSLEQKPSFLELSQIVRKKVYDQPYLTDPDGDTIFFAKEVARQHKVNFKDILACMRPTGSLNRPVWDSTGKIVPYKKIFY